MAEHSRLTHDVRCPLRLGVLCDSASKIFIRQKMRRHFFRETEILSYEPPRRSRSDTMRFSVPSSRYFRRFGPGQSVCA